MHSLLKKGRVINMDFINKNVIDCLKQEIDAYRDKYAIALQEIKELNYFSKEDNDKLKADLSCKDDCIMDLKAEIKSLKAENDKLKHSLKHKAIKVHQDRIPKEYKAEADEYFSHNPKSKYVAFYMLSEYDVKDGEGGVLMLHKDDALIIIHNDNS